MHIVIAVVTLLGALAVWYWRFKMAKEAGSELLEVADDLRGSVRRLMYKRKHNKHPADSIDDARLAASGIAVAVAQPIRDHCSGKIRTEHLQCPNPRGR